MLKRSLQVAVAPGLGAPSPSPGMPPMPAMRRMPAMPMPTLEFHATGQTTNLFGFPCRQYELQRRSQTMDIWATDQLPPERPYVRHQTHGSGPLAMEEPWSAWLAAQKLFPMRVTLRRDPGVDRILFMVHSVTPEKLTDENAKVFEPPPGYIEIQPLPF